MTSSFDVFLSYNSADRPIVAEIAERLRDETGIAPWFDRWQLAVGDNWQHGLEEGLKQSGACAIFAGPSGLGEWQLDEIRSAQVLRKERKEFQIVPVLLPGSDSKTLPLFLRSNFNWIDLRGGIDAHAIRSLVAGVKGEGQAASARTEASDKCPYKGLDAYQESDAEFFFGRDVFVEQILLEHLRNSRSIAVVGMSGSGKSSAVRAGLLPRLRQDRFKGSAPQHIITLKPGERPLEELAVQLVGALYPATDRVLHLHSLLERLQSSEETLHLVLRAASNAGPFLILIDQFEEVFTLCSDEAQRQRFFSNICYAASLSDSPVHIVITMRSDFVSKCASYPDMNMLISENFLQMPNMSLADIRAAIVEPARRAGLRFEHGLIEVVMHDVEESAASLPLLQHALLRLWEKRDGALLTIAAYHEIGGVQGSLVRHADEIFTTLSLDQQELCRKIFLRLVTLGEGTGDTRRRAYQEELLALGAGAVAILHTLIEKRLLVGAKESSMSDHAGGKETVEIIHEALIRGWPRLHAWLNEDRDFLRFRHRLSIDVQEWDKRGRSHDDVYRGAHLFEAEEFLNTHGDELTPAEKQFVQDGIARRQADTERERKAKVRLRRISIVASIGFVLSLIGGLIADHLYTLSHSRELASEVFLAQTADPAFLLRRAIEAYSASPTFEAGQALRFALRESSSRIIIEHNHATAIRCSPWEDKLAVGSEDSTIHLWSIPDQKLLFVLRGQDAPISSLYFTDSGRKLLSIAENWTICVWDTKTGVLIRKLALERWHAIEVSSNNRVAICFPDASFKVYDAVTGNVLLSGPPHTADGMHIAADGRYIACGVMQLGRPHFVFWNIDQQRELMRTQQLTNYRGILFISNTPYVILSQGANGMRDPTANDREDTTYFVFDLSKASLAAKWRTAPVVSWSSRVGESKLAIAYSRSIEVVDFDPYDPHHNRSILPFDASGLASNMVIDPTGSFLLHITPGEASLSVWSIKEARRIVLRGHAGGIVQGDFAADGKYIVTQGADRSVAIWPTTSDWAARQDEEVASLYGGASYYSRFVNDSLVWTFRGDSSYVLTNLNEQHDGGPRIETGSLHINREHLFGQFPLLMPVHWIEKYPDHLRLWDFPKFAAPRDIPEPIDDPTNIALVDSDMTTLAEQPLSGHGLRIVDATSGHVLRTIPVDGTTGMWYNNRKIALVNDNNNAFQLYNIESGKLLYTWPAPMNAEPRGDFSSDGTIALMATPDSLILVSTTTGKRLFALAGDFRPTGGDYSWLGGVCPDNKKLWLQNANGYASLWDIESGKEDKVRFQPLNDRILKLTFNRSMTRAVGACTHGSIEVWDARTGELLSDIPYGTSSSMAELSHSGKYILAQGDNKVVQVYYTEIADVLALAKSRLMTRTSGDFQKF